MHTDCVFGAIMAIILAFGAGYRIGQRVVREENEMSDE